MEKKGFKIQRVISNTYIKPYGRDYETTFFRLIRDCDNAILCAYENIGDVLEEYGNIMENSDCKCVLDEYVETIDQTFRPIKFYLELEKENV